MKAITDVSRKARKPHKCQLCGLEIQNEEEYSYQFCKDSGDVWTFKSHYRCISLAIALDLHKEDGVNEDVFKEEIRKQFNTRTFMEHQKATWEEVLKGMYKLFNIPTHEK